MPNFQIASEVAAIYPVTVANGQTKRINVTASRVIKDNAMVYAASYMGDSTVPSAWAYFQGNMAQQTVWFDFTTNGHMMITTLLKPEFHNKRANGQGQNVYDFFIGTDAGTGQDFQGSQGADIGITFLPGLQSSNPTPYGKTPLLISPDILKQLGFLINIEDAVFDGKANDNQALRFSVDADANNKKMIEDNVWIHLYDGAGNLKGIVDTNENVSTFFNHLDTGFQFLAFVKVTPDPGNPGRGFIFEIGDPKTDAAVSVDEV
ncbi:MAG TPA: hypothetical protein PKC76_17020 [Saprospiraceae bacterium]|nr:hypothetical protein [Saprospiraceae bacterium]HMP25836.1 hypothetical protein [Saprospiraceae bacterium]